MIAMTSFPRSESLTVGSFWVAVPGAETAAPSGASEAATTAPGAESGPAYRGQETTLAGQVVADEASAAELHGFCRIEGGIVEIDVSGELTPSMVWRRSANGSGMVGSPAPEPDDIDVHGSVSIAPWRVSLLGCRTKSRRRHGLADFGGGPSHHVLRAVWAVVGAHVSTADRFSGVRLQVGGLEEWAVTSGLEQTMQRGETVSTALRYEARPAVVTPFTAFDESAELSLGSVGRISPIDVHGGHIRTSNWLTLTALSGWTLQDAMSLFVLPVQTLMTLLTGSRAPVRQVEVLVGDRWCQVFGRHLDPWSPDERPVTMQTFLGTEELSLAHVARWLEVAQMLSPAPQIVAAGLGNEFTTADTEALVMATAAEGLDRRLRPGARAFDEMVIEQAHQVLQEVDIDERLRRKVIGAVSQYLWEPSMPQRLSALATSVAGAVPDCVGQVSRWKSAVTSMRNSGAHGFARPETDRTATGDPGSVDGSGPRADAAKRAAEELLAMRALSLSLRWAMRVRVLQAAGVGDQALRDALNHWPEYERDRDHWSHHWPRIYRVVN
jgi:hypothetical protein